MTVDLGYEVPGLRMTIIDIPSGHSSFVHSCMWFNHETVVIEEKDG